MKTKILIFTIFNLLFFSGCDDDGDDTPTMNTCILYGNDPVACVEAGCTVMGGSRSVVRDGRCIANMPFGCFPLQDDECSSVGSAHCTVSPDDHDSVALFKSCSMNWGIEWVQCPAGEGWGNEDCYPDPVLCEAQTTLDACHAEYCTWVQDAVKAIFDEGVCTGWETQAVSFCTAYVGSNKTILFREADPVTEMYKLGEVQHVPNAQYFKLTENPDLWSTCSGLPSVDDPICSSCPEPAK